MYSSYYYINKNFQSSINLELDLYDEDKINEYIPTSDICDVLKIYIKSILGINNEKSTTLVGPYGKGKSFLLLVLSYLVSKNKSSSCWENLVEKIKIVDQELFNLLKEVEKRDISLLTILINSNYDNITQSFQLALNESLKREGLDNLIPQTIYTLCLDIIDKWKNNKEIKANLFKKCIEINKINLSELEDGLKNNSPVSYKQFEDLYNCMSIGLKFNPLVSNDVVKLYSDVNYELGKNGYNGMFIVFDEFSKFIDSNSSNLMVDLKIIQDMAECCSRSDKKQQMNLCCVTHKSISLYSTVNKKGNDINAFKTVEGRFKEIKFNRSLEENYQIISYAIKKIDKNNEIAKEFVDKNLEFYDEIKSLDIFNDNNIKNDLFIGCFPLNPLTAYMLIQLSEIIAQNERTLFTFLSDSDENSFNSFIHNNSDGLFNVDKIYDYFTNLLQKEETNSIRNIWYRSEAILSKVETNFEKRIIKVLAICLMLNDYDKLSPTNEVIALSINADINDVKITIENLINRHYIRKNILNNMLTFALSNSKHIDDSIEYLSKTKYKSIKLSEWIEKINDKKYVLPRRYNENNKITRFFSVVFIDESTYMNCSNFDQFFKERYCDGIILYLIRKSLMEEEIKKKIDMVGEPKVIVKYPTNCIDDNLDSLLLRYACLNDVKNKDNVDDIIVSEVNYLIEETEVDVLSLLREYYEIDVKYYSCMGSNASFNELLSITLEKEFTSPIIFNNELINKKIVTKQYQKAVDHVIDYYIDNLDEFTYSETSSEMSIKRSIFDANQNNENFRNIIEKIKEQICDENKRFKISDFMLNLTNPPYGIRVGILPLLLGKAISELSDNVILYYQDKEIEMNSDNLVKSITNDKYYIGFSKSSIQQKKYLEYMIKKFKITSSNNFRQDTILLSEALRKYFIGQPQILRSNKINDNYLSLDENIIKLKDYYLSFNINPYESVFVKPKQIFNKRNYNFLKDEFAPIDTIIHNRIEEYKDSVVMKIKETLKINQESSIKMELKGLIDKHKSQGYKLLLSDNDKLIMDTIVSNSSFDDIEFANILCKACINLYIEDWDRDNINLVCNKLNNFILNLNNAEQIKESHFDLCDSKMEISDIGILLQNNIESILDEFSDSISTKEKIYILTEFIKKLL